MTTFAFSPSTPYPLPLAPNPPIIIPHSLIPMIDLDQVRKVAHLARLELTPDEELQFTTQLGSILEYFEQLSELDTENVEPTTRAIDVSNVTRPDTLEIFAGRADILDCAPEREEDYFKVPKILQEE